MSTEYGMISTFHKAFCLWNVKSMLTQSEWQLSVAENLDPHLDWMGNVCAHIYFTFNFLAPWILKAMVQYIISEVPY